MHLVSIRKGKLISVTKTHLVWHLDSGYVSSTARELIAQTVQSPSNLCLIYTDKLLCSSKESLQHV